VAYPLTSRRGLYYFRSKGIFVGPTFIRDVEKAVTDKTRVKIADVTIPDVRVNSVLNDEQKALIRSTISQIGIVQAPVVRLLETGKYEIIAGKTRMLEAQAQGADEIDVIVVPADSKTALIMNITENIARGSYEYISIARAIRELKRLGSSEEDLRKVFPWGKQWIGFLEGLQDLPDDIVEAIREHKLTPSHVQAALILPTPEEVHSGLQTARDLGWDSKTLRTYAENRADEVRVARQKAEEQGVAPVIPLAQPQELIQYKQCLGCGYKKPAQTITIQLLCEDCLALIKYVTGQLGDPKEAITQVYNALAFFQGQPVESELPPPPPKEEPSQA
jgi:ParB/RepB/Spo0J family partition protein